MACRGYGRSGAGGTGLRGGICERESEIMWPVNEDPFTSLYSPGHERNKPAYKHEPRRVPFATYLSLSFSFPSLFHRNPLLLIRPATLARGGRSSVHVLYVYSFPFTVFIFLQPFSLWRMIPWWCLNKSHEIILLILIVFFTLYRLFRPKLQWLREKRPLWGPFWQFEK